MEADDDTWEAQNNRCRDRGETDGCRPWDLANAFRAYADIAGAFIAKKKDKDGRTFGFVSFKSVRDLDELKVNLSTVRSGGNKLVVNVALFARENREVNSSSVKGGGVKVADEGQNRVHGGLPKVRGFNAVNNGVSFLDILTNKTHAVHDEDEVIIDPSTFFLSSLTGRAVVGRTLGFKELSFLKSSLSAAGFEEASLQYLGGLSLLISFENGESVKRLLDVKEVWNHWFSSLSPWLGQSLPYKHLSWVNILGVPPHLVSRGVFDAIGSMYGKVIQHSQFLETDGDLTFDRLGILLDTGNRINGVINLSW
ncbi:putative RNA recognition motif domain, nucleotide-binding alpha-beta plait domain superfamily [Helianthus annuus]|nr:putative RNA recognition motif domain, nucleotide-binding alpha-beta plait domain superfamily [Helianthus annuus]